MHTIRKSQHHWHTPASVPLKKRIPINKLRSFWTNWNTYFHSRFDPNHSFKFSFIWKCPCGGDGESDTFSRIVVVSEEAVVNLAGFYVLIHRETRWLHWEKKQKGNALSMIRAHAFSPESAARHADAQSWWRETKPLDKQTTGSLCHRAAGEVCTAWFNVNTSVTRNTSRVLAFKSAVWDASGNRLAFLSVSLYAR